MCGDFNRLYTDDSPGSTCLYQARRLEIALEKISDLYYSGEYKPTVRITCMPNKYGVLKLDNDDSIFLNVNGDFDASAATWTFDTKEQAELYIKENLRSSPSEKKPVYTVMYVPQTTKPEEPRLAFRSPGFFDLGEPSTAEFVATNLCSHEWHFNFRPVDKVTGAFQVSDVVVTDVLNEAAAARVLTFSFPGYMLPAEVNRLQDAVINTYGWLRMRYAHAGSGCAKYFCIHLYADVNPKATA